VRVLPRENMHALTGVYALDAMPGRERDRFERHLTQCAACDSEVRSLQDTATRFALAVTLQPPAQLRERVMAAAARTRQLSPAPHALALPQPGRPRWVNRVAIPLAGACLVLAVVLGILLGLARSELGTTRTQQQQVAAVLTAPGARLVSVRTSVGGHATVVVASSLHEMVFTSKGMPGLPSSKVYQLWVIAASGRATSAGLLSLAADGTTAPVLAARLVRGDTVGVTVEPAGGTTKPTTTPIVLIPLPS
jgi:anti-sigma-K factor RskA